MSKTTDSLSSTCVLCCQAIKIYAVGSCNHHICFKCSTKMRVICNQMYCAVCRTDLMKVIFSNKLHPFEGIISHKFPHDRKYGIFFASSRIQEEYRKFLANKCELCGIKRPPDSSFKQLQDHMRRDHELFACQLCVDHVKVPSSERKFYNRRDLAQHRRSGDPDDKSYRGHPNCHFCDERYFDKDELWRHLRKDHFFCHFCESDGINNNFFGEYPDLEDHFRTDHYLCEEDGCCNVQFTNAFRTDIDLKAHKTKIHSGKMTKIQARQTRQVEVEVNLPARPTAYSRGRRDSGRGRGGRDRYRQDRTDMNLERATIASYESAHREEIDRETKKTKVKTKKPRDQRRGSRPEEERSESPIENLHSRNEPRVSKEADKENESVPESLPVVAGDAYTSTELDTAPVSESYAPSAAVNPPYMGDFPTLAGQSDAPFQMGGRWSTAPSQNTEEFPALGNGDNGSTNVPLNVATSFSFYTEKHSSKGTPNTQPVEPTHQPVQPSGGDEEFPTLSSIASILGVKPNSVKSKKKKKQKAQEKTQNETLNNNAKPFSSIVGEQKDDKKVKGPDKVPSKPMPSKPVEKICIPPQMQSSENVPSSSVASSSSLSRPPPGFGNLSQSTLSSSLVQPPPGFTSLTPEFVPPPNFKERNCDLVSKIQDFCMGSDDLFSNFKQDSGEFRQGMITAGEYYRRCVETLSEGNFHQIFNELVSLLPDVTKQQALLLVHNDYKAAAASQPQRDAVLKISNKKSGNKTAWRASPGKSGSSLCPVCSQIVMATDLANHMNSHEDFPALAASRVAPRPVGVVNKTWGGASWGKGK